MVTNGEWKLALVQAASFKDIYGSNDSKLFPTQNVSKFVIAKMLSVPKWNILTLNVMICDASKWNIVNMLFTCQQNTEISKNSKNELSDFITKI